MFTHETVDGRRLLVIHGDFFDHLTTHAAWVNHLGDRAYTAALHLNKWMNLARRSLGYPYWSSSALLKTKGKRAVNFINDFEHFVARYTKKKGCSGVVCGHICLPSGRSTASTTSTAATGWSTARRLSSTPHQPARGSAASSFAWIDRLPGPKAVVKKRIARQ